MMACTGGYQFWGAGIEMGGSTCVWLTMTVYAFIQHLQLKCNSIVLVLIKGSVNMFIQ